MKKTYIGTTLKDIAKEANLGISTVSTILSGKDNGNYISEKTKKYVKELAREMNYVPNFAYKLLKKQKTNTVSIFAGSNGLFDEPHIQKTILLITKALEDKGYSCYINILKEDSVYEIVDLVNRGTEIFIFITIPKNYSMIKEILKDKFVITINNENNSFTPDILLDSTSAIYNILKYFVKNNKKNFKMLTHNSHNNDRIKAVLKLFPNQTNIINKYMVFFDESIFLLKTFVRKAFETGYELTKNIMEKDNTVNAVFYHSDIFATGGIKYLHDNGYNIGKDIFIGGMNNSYISEYGPYPFSSAEYDYDNIVDTILHFVISGKKNKIVIKKNVYLR